MEVINDKDIYMIKNIYFNKIDLPIVYIFDSNIVVDIGKLYYKPTSLDIESKYALLNLINYIREEGIEYDAKYALTELSTDRVNGGVIEEKYRRLQSGLNKIMNMPLKKFRKHVLYSNRVISNNTSFVDFPENPDMANIIKNTLMALNYAYVILAKFFILLNLYGERNKEKIYSELLEFAHYEIKAISLYEFSAIIFYLFSSDDEFTNSQNLMKVNKKLELVKKVFNISWDLTYLRYMNELTGRYLSKEIEDIDCKNYVLVTKDKALAKISELLICDSNSEIDGKFVPNIIIDCDKIKEKYRDVYEEYYYKYNSDEVRNSRIQMLKNMDSIDHMNKLDKLTNQLTLELLNMDKTKP